MRKFQAFSLLVLIIAVFSVLISCDNDPEPNTDFLPEKFSVEIPAAISSESSGGRTQADTLNGNVVYLNLATFIAVGSGSARLVEEFIAGIRRYALENVETATFISADDNRQKNLVVQRDVEFGGKEWEFMLTLTDAESEGKFDGGLALQIFWNHGAPIHGIAIVKPYNCNRTDNAGLGDAIFQIKYDEQTETGYDAQMEVSISGLPQYTGNPFEMRTLHMFAGRKGDVVDVYGNSTHPNARLFNSNQGFAWVFVAAGSNVDNIGVAEVGLPPLYVDSSNRTELLKDFSIKNVFTASINIAFPGLPPAVVSAYLKNTSAPGYFDNKGFEASGKSPGAKWDALTGRLDALSPYNPKATANLVLKFKD